jgi:uncharacterized protein
MRQDLVKFITNFFANHTHNLGPVRLVVIQPSTFCNLNCDYCYLPNRNLKFEISLDLIDSVFKRIFSSTSILDRGFTIVWHAGEPLTVPISFYSSALEKINCLNYELNVNPYEITHSIQTNGTLINQDWCDFIKQHKLQIGVSLDGPDFIHDSHRKTWKGKGTHSNTMRGVKLLKENNIPFSVIAVLTDKSLDYPDEIFNFFVENQVNYVGFNIEEIEAANQSSSLNTEDNAERYRIFMSRLYELVKSNNESLVVREFEQIKEFILGKRNISDGQFSPFSMINIAYNGDFSTFSPELLSMESEIYGDFILGNVLLDSFDSILQTRKFRKILSDIQTGVKLCRRTCQYFAVCGGGAPSNKYYENGSFRTSETLYCRYTKMILTDIVLSDIEQSFGLS